MDLGLRGKTVLVTASSKGIGKACALALAAQNANIVMCARGPDQLDAAAQEVREATGAEVLAQPADLTRPDTIDALLDAARRRFGGIDVLVAIGGSPKRGGFDAITEDDLRDAFEMSVIALFRLIKAVLPGMRERKWGRIVTVQSRSVREPVPELVTSVATRPGVAGLFKYLSKETARDGVLINTIVPGRILTDRLKGGTQVSTLSADEYMRSKLADIPVGRFGEAAEIADAVAFLVSERASYINGAVLQVDGGVINGI